MTIIKTVMYADFGDPRLHDRDLGALKPRKNGHFCHQNLIIHL